MAVARPPWRHCETLVLLRRWSSGKCLVSKCFLILQILSLIFVYWVLLDAKVAMMSKIPRALSSVQSLSRVRLFATPWIAAQQASLPSKIQKKKVLSVMKGVCTSCDKVWKQGPNPELTGGDGEGKGHFSLREPRSQLCGEGRKGKETEVTARVIAPKHRVVWCVYSTQKGIHGGREWLFSPSLAILLYSKGGSCWGSDDH